MDFGAVDLGSLVCCSSSVTVASNNGGFSFEMDKQKGLGSGLLKQEMGVNERTHCSNLHEGQLQMFGFSSPSSSQIAEVPYHHQTSNGFSRGTGLNSDGDFSGMRIPFTPPQWMELEHQVLIYKYITSNVAIPSCLLNPIRKSLESAGFSTFSGLRSTPLGWGAFHLGGFSSSDLEPGRCRRTDGKKWRCSKDAVADKKYCERHMNRGRHRSRKPVEGQSGHVATRTNTATDGKPAPITTTTPTAAGAKHQQQKPGSEIMGALNDKPAPITTTTTTSAGAASSSLSASQKHQQQKPGSEIGNFERSLLDKEHSSYSITKQETPFQELDQSSNLGQFMDAWIESQSDRTRLSISIPMEAALDFMPSPSSSPTSSKLQRSSQELEMCLAVGTTAAQHNQGEDSNWIPISWEPSMAGPLGEVLHSTACATGDLLNAKPLNLMENLQNSTHLVSSPTEVLSRYTFGSLSNSSAGSSPRAESSKAVDGTSL